MAWNNKCPHGGPLPFDPDAACEAADFSEAVYVNTADSPDKKWDRTRYAYSYVEVVDGEGDSWIVCVVGHAHETDGEWEPGNIFIPGWDGFSVKTPDEDVEAIAALPNNRGEFPGNDRYPRPQGGDNARSGPPPTIFTETPPPEASPVKLKLPDSSSSLYNIPVKKYYTFNETGNIMISSTVDSSQPVSQAAQDLFEEVAVFMAALTATLATTPRPDATKPYSLSDYYTLFDYAPIAAILERSGMFVHVEQEDYEFHRDSVTATFNMELIVSILGFAATDGANIAALQNILRSMGKHATFGFTRTGSADKVGHLTFVCEYLLGMPIVSVEYYYIDQETSSTVVEIGPCIKTHSGGITLNIHKDTYMFVVPDWIRKYSGDLASVAQDAEYQLLQEEMRGWITGSPVVLGVESVATGAAPATLTAGSSYTLQGLNFGPYKKTIKGEEKKGSVSIGGVTQTIANADAWAQAADGYSTITFKAVAGTASAAATGNIVVSLPDGTLAQSMALYAVKATS